jgi:hypothetical protein
MSKYNIVKDLKNKILDELSIDDEFQLTRNEIDIINICADVINGILEEKSETDDLNRNLNIQIKNLKINVENLLEEKEELKDEIRDLRKNEY